MPVGIAKNNTSLFESSVYRALERDARKKGLFNHDEGLIVKSASEKVNKLKSTGKLEQDIALLVSALREQGLEKQANNIESKFVAFKQAENKLYNLPKEDLMEFAHLDGDVEIAPSESDYGKVETVQSAAKKIREIAEKEPKKASLDLKKKAQLDPIAQTEQRVQNALDRIEEAKNSLNLDTSKFKLDNLQDKNVAEAYSLLSGVPLENINHYVAVRKIINNIFGNKQLNKEQAVQAISNAIANNPEIATALANSLGVDLSQYQPISENAAISALKKVFDPLGVTERLGLVKNEVSKNINKLANDIYTNLYNSFIYVLGHNRDKFDAAVNKLLSSYSNIKNSFDEIQMPEASEFVNISNVNYNLVAGLYHALYNKVLEIVESDDAKLLNNILSKIAPEEHKKMGDFSLNLGKVITDAVSAIPPEDSPMRQEVPNFAAKLAPAVEFWQNKYNEFAEGSQDKTNAGLNLATLARLQKGLAPWTGKPFINLKSALLKINESLPKELPPQPLPQINSVDEMNKYLDLLIQESQEKKASLKSDLVKTVRSSNTGFLLPTSDTGSKPQGAGRPAEPSQTPAGTSPSVARPTDAEKKAVIAMQRLLGKFSQAISEKAEEIAQKIQMPVDNVRNLASTIGFTGKSGETSEGTHDGKWGPNTEKALQAAKAIAERLGKKGELTSVNAAYTQRDPKEVEKDAKKNVEGLISVMKEADLAPYLGEYNIELDYIPRYRSMWTEETADPLNFKDPQTGFVVMPEHVRSIRDFFSMVSAVAGAPKAASKEEFSKIAQEIKDSTIIHDPWSEEEKANAPTGSMSYNDFIEYLKWFYNRSNLVYRTALSRQRAGEPNPLTGKPYTNKEIAIARAYHEQMQRLVSEWRNTYNDYFKQKGHIHPNDFIRAERGDFTEQTQGVGRAKEDKTRPGRGGGGYTISLGPDSDKDSLEPPLDDFINVFKLIDEYHVNSDASAWLTQNLKTGVFDRKEWRRSYVDELVANYSKFPKTKLENLKFLSALERNMIVVIHDVFNDWEGRIEDYLDERRVQRLYRKQNREKQRWIEIFKSKTEEARRLLRA